MKKLLFINTYKKGYVRGLVYKEGKKYVGVCLELDLVIHGDNLFTTGECLTKMVKGYLENAVKNKLPESVLNRPAPDKYWAKFNEAIEFERQMMLRKALTGVREQKTSPTMILRNNFSQGRQFAFN